MHDDEKRLVRRSHLAERSCPGDDFQVEPADKDDVRALMLGIMRANGKLDDILYILGEDDDEEEEEAPDR